MKGNKRNTGRRKKSKKKMKITKTRRMTSIPRKHFAVAPSKCTPWKNPFSFLDTLLRESLPFGKIPIPSVFKQQKPTWVMCLLDTVERYLRAEYAAFLGLVGCPYCHCFISCGKCVWCADMRLRVNFSSCRDNRCRSGE